MPRKYPASIFCVLSLFITVFLCGTAWAQDEAKPAKLFESDSTLEVTLHAPWRDIQRKPDVQEPYAATMEWTDDTGTHKVDLQVERRGITRQRVCQFPPIRLIFDKETVKGTNFRGQEKLKMVTHCDKGSRWEQYYIKEMLIYRIFNLFTDVSFRIRPLAITYIDSEKGGSPNGPRFAFLIEDDSDAAKRNDMKKLKIDEIAPSQIDKEHASIFALFQLLIGNVDWSALSGPKVTCCHNAKLAATPPANDPVFVLPYDFDSSGLVNAPYAAPPEGIPINSVTQRVYRGFCAHNETMEAARQEMIAREQDVYAMLDTEPRLKGRDKKWSAKYLAGFYKLIKDDKDWEKKIIGKCRK